MRTAEHRKASIAARLITLVIVAAFGFHLSRFYLSVEFCAHHTKDGSAMQHCKDVVGWLTAPRAQMDEVAAPAYDPLLQTVPMRIETPAAPVADVALPPPFHPPRFLS